MPSGTGRVWVFNTYEGQFEHLHNPKRTRNMVLGFNEHCLYCGWAFDFRRSDIIDHLEEVHPEIFFECVIKGDIVSMRAFNSSSINV